ncbi:hypothetical protein WG66_006593 [Moniliophthora roreri]|nr:hypothetical protein WG66_006593 [Moniliophthora roreri]
MYNPMGTRIPPSSPLTRWSEAVWRFGCFFGDESRHRADHTYPDPKERQPSFLHIKPMILLKDDWESLEGEVQNAEDNRGPATKELDLASAMVDGGLTKY